MLIIQFVGCVKVAVSIHSGSVGTMMSCGSREPRSETTSIIRKREAGNYEAKPWTNLLHPYQACLFPPQNKGSLNITPLFISYVTTLQTLFIGVFRECSMPKHISTVISQRNWRINRLTRKPTSAELITDKKKCWQQRLHEVF